MVQLKVNQCLNPVMHAGHISRHKHSSVSTVPGCTAMLWQFKALTQQMFMFETKACTEKSGLERILGKK